MVFKLRLKFLPSFLFSKLEFTCGSTNGSEMLRSLESLRSNLCKRVAASVLCLKLLIDGYDLSSKF